MRRSSSTTAAARDHKLYWCVRTGLDEGNMYPNGPPKRRLEVTQSEVNIKIVRIEGEKQWVMNVGFDGQKTENSPTSTCMRGCNLPANRINFAKLLSLPALIV